MDFQKKLELGVEKGIITSEQKDGLINLFKNDDNNEMANTSGVVKLLYYIGGFIMLCAMSVLMSHTIQHGTYTKILLLGAIYAGIFFIVAEYLWKKAERLPAAILYFLFITMFSFIVTDITKMTGFFPHFSDMHKYDDFIAASRPAVLIIGILTIIANTFLMRFRKSSFLIVPTLSCIYSIYFVTANIFWDFSTLMQHCVLNFIFALALIMFGFVFDKQTKSDYSLWMYFIGAIGLYQSLLIIFTDAFNLKDGQIELLILLMSLIYLIFGILIKRKAFTVIGILGIIQYVFYLEFEHIKGNTTLLTSTIIATGLLILYAGVVYGRQIDMVSEKMENLLPEKIKNYLPQNRTK